MERIRVCVVGYGNVGREAVECVKQAPDMELAGVVRRSLQGSPAHLPVVTRVEQLERIDTAILTLPSRSIPAAAAAYLQRGINTVDGYDIHGEEMLALRENLGALARANGRVAVIGAGWDPGTDSIIRMLFHAIAPGGSTHTDYGPGVSMGHSTAARAVPGVIDALSMTLPLGGGKHRREVYVILDQRADPAVIAKKIREDPYFRSDPTAVIAVEDLGPYRTTAHGVAITRTGSAGTARRQRLELKMRIVNPAAAAQIMISAARASRRLQPGGYVLGEIPPIDLLPAGRENAIALLV